MRDTRKTRMNPLAILAVFIVFVMFTSIVVLECKLLIGLGNISKALVKTNEAIQEIYAENVAQEWREYVDEVNYKAITLVSDRTDDAELMKPYITQEMKAAIAEREEQKRLEAEAKAAEEARLAQLRAAGGQPLFESYVDDICQNLYPDVPAEMIKAIIYRESKWNPNCLGDHGTSYGLMQIKPKWHQWRADKLGVTDWLDPYGNILVGVDLMNDYIQTYESLALALMVYNGGAKYAMNNYNKGYISDYATGVLTEAGLPVR